MAFNIPNCLTLFRLIVIPIIVIIHIADVKYANWCMVVCFALAGISDALDGYLARLWNQTSKLGAFLDPVADKLLVSTLLVLIVSDPEVLQNVWFKWFFIINVMIIIGREILVSALREWMAELGRRTAVAVSNVGKYKTGMQMGAIGCLLFKNDFIGLPILRIGEFLLYGAGILTIWSMMIYLSAAFQEIKKH